METTAINKVKNPPKPKTNAIIIKTKDNSWGGDDAWLDKLKAAPYPTIIKMRATNQKTNVKINNVFVDKFFFEWVGVGGRSRLSSKDVFFWNI
jgi:hypothetical protein